MNQTTLSIEGMSCNHCKMAVEQAVGAVAGVQSVHVNLEAKHAEISWDGPATLAAIKRAVEDCGYTPK